MHKYSLEDMMKMILIIRLSPSNMMGDYVLYQDPPSLIDDLWQIYGSMYNCAKDTNKSLQVHSKFFK
jgi:hypothetical protein